MMRDLLDVVGESFVGGLWDAFTDGLAQFGDFRSRADQGEFAMFFASLFLLAVTLGLTCGCWLSAASVYVILACLGAVCLVPAFAMCVRRLNDIRASWVLGRPGTRAGSEPDFCSCVDVYPEPLGRFFRRFFSA